MLVRPSANDLNFKPFVFRWKSLLSPSIYNSIKKFSKTLTQDKKANKRVRSLNKCLVKKFFLVFFLEFSFMVINIEFIWNHIFITSRISLASINILFRDTSFTRVLLKVLLRSFVQQLSCSTFKSNRARLFHHQNRFGLFMFASNANEIVFD